MEMIRGPAIDQRGDVRRDFPEADVIIEGEYRTQVQTIAAWNRMQSSPIGRDDGLTVRISTQFTANIQPRVG